MQPVLFLPLMFYQFNPFIRVEIEPAETAAVLALSLAAAGDVPPDQAGDALGICGAFKIEPAAVRSDGHYRFLVPSTDIGAALQVFHADAENLPGFPHVHPFVPFLPLVVRNVPL